MNFSVRQVGLGIAILCAAWSGSVTAQIESFIGHYEGSAEVEVAGQSQKRDLSVDILDGDDGGYTVKWKSTIYKSSGKVKEKEYKINFVSTKRKGIYSSAMGTNVFGNPVALDPMKGDPYVWARIQGNVMTVYSLLIDEQGGYEMQEYHRTLVEGGLELDYRRVRNGEPLRSVKTFLKRK
ncbi:MAG: hypothetical protein AAF402_04355 [Pseudomonadota bacterium]